MASRSTPVYEFGNFRLDTGKRLLLGRDGAPVPLTPKAYETLAYLVDHAGTVVGKEEMMRAIWPDTAVEENNLTQNISLLRRVLGEGRGEHRYIATVPGRGYQFVAGVGVAGPAGPAAPLSEPAAEASIAVLPFVNVSADPDIEFFGDGLADELINRLSKLARVRVAARTSAFSFKGKQAHVREIASGLGVSLVLEGSVRKSGGRLRITAQLVNAADGYQLWSERYDREIEMRDLFEVQDEITLAVMDALKPSLPRGERAAVLKHSTENVKAHELYLKGRFHAFRMTASGIEAGIRCFEKAIEADPGYALAHVGLAHAYRMFGLSLDMPPGEVGPKAKAAALQAIAIDDSLAEAHAVLAFTLFWYEWAWSAAERHFKRALELNPNSADTHWMYAHLPSNMGRHGEALAAIGRARELDPLSGLINAMEGQFLLHAGRTEEAVARLKDALELDARSRVAHSFAASAYTEQARFDEAIAEARMARDLCPSNSQALAYEGYAQARAGRHAEACEALAALRQLSTGRHVPPYNIALLYNGLDRCDEALAWLERAVEQRDPWMLFLKVEPKWKNIRQDRRFVELLKRINRGPAWPPES
jgi:TolB-like protein/Tfp pilus assembly protein PilF